MLVAMLHDFFVFDSNCRFTSAKIYVEPEVKTKKKVIIFNEQVTYSAKLFAWVNHTKLGVRSLYNFWKGVRD